MEDFGLDFDDPVKEKKDRLGDDLQDAANVGDL